MSNKIGVFVCHCGINIASMVDVKKLVEYAKKLDGVAVSKDYKYMCSDVGANLIKDSTKKHEVERVGRQCHLPEKYYRCFWAQNFFHCRMQN